jgi:hypothetical protein
LDDFEEGIEALLAQPNWEKSQIVRLFNDLLPEFSHKEVGRFLDEKMLLVK